MLKLVFGTVFETVLLILIIWRIIESRKEIDSKEHYFKQLVICIIAAVMFEIEVFVSETKSDVIIDTICVLILVFDARANYTKYRIYKKPMER